MFVLCAFLWLAVKYPQSFANIDRISSLYVNVIRKMDSVFEAYLGPDAGILSEPDDIPKTNDPVWILGKQYNAIQGKLMMFCRISRIVTLLCLFTWLSELETIRRDVQSRLWCTYRRGFVPIGNPQLTTDKGWGCVSIPMFQCYDIRSYID